MGRDTIDLLKLGYHHPRQVEDYDMAAEVCLPFSSFEYTN